MRHILFNVCGIISFTKLWLCHACSFAACTVYLLNKANQTQKVFDSEKWAPGRHNNKWIHWTDVRPLERYGRSAPFHVVKENATSTCDSSYAIYFKLDISVGMERMDDPEGLVVKILMGRSWTILLSIIFGAGGRSCSRPQLVHRYEMQRSLRACVDHAAEGESRPCFRISWPSAWRPRTILGKSDHCCHHIFPRYIPLAGRQLFVEWRRGKLLLLCFHYPLPWLIIGNRSKL